MCYDLTGGRTVVKQNKINRPSRVDGSFKSCVKVIYEICAQFFLTQCKYHIAMEASIKDRAMSLKSNSKTYEPKKEVTLSQEQINFYWDNGYLVVKDVVDFETLYSCKQRFVEICNARQKPPQMTVMKDLHLTKKGLTGERAVNKLQDILYDDTFSLYIENQALLSIVVQILGPNVTASHTMFINKPPGTGRHPPHQDLYYFPFRPADKIVAAWTAVDEVTSQNGCLYVIPGSHKSGVIHAHDYPTQDGVTYKMYHGLVDENNLAPEDQRVVLEMSPGDTVFFHPVLIHGSGPNVTEFYRKSLSCHYSATDCKYIEVKGTVQDKIAREVEDLVLKRGLEIPFDMIWKLKSRVVRGRMMSHI